MSIKVGLISLGCAKNLVDSENMLAKMKDAGMEIIADAEGADVVVVNTCGFIESAKTEAIEQILDMVSLKEEGKVGSIVVTGCLTQRYKDEFFTLLPEVDAILGTGSYEDIVEAVYNAVENKKYSNFADINCGEISGKRLVSTPQYTAFIKIAEGCDNRCHYCVIPSLRGDYRSREMEDIINEAKALVEDGATELIVIAQDITRYGLDLYGQRRLDVLAKELCKIEGLKWLRLHYLYPDEITDELIDTIASEDKIVKYLDIPIQHANNKILENMNRRGTQEYLRGLFAKLRSKIDGLVIRTSLIVGYPGETDVEFTDLCDFIKETKIERAGVFCFSREEGSVAYDMEDQVDDDVKERRQFILEEIASRNIDAYNENMMGKEIEVLVEGYEDFTKQYFGRSYADSPDIDGKIFFTATGVQVGEYVKVKITGDVEGDLGGEAI